MQNLMICDNDISYIENLVNSISKNINNLNVYNISTKLNWSAFDIIAKREVDIIVINVDIEGIDIIKFIEENNIEIYKKSVILLYKDLENVKKLYNPIFNKYIFKCIKSSRLDALLVFLQDIVYNKENTNDDIIINAKIERELRKLKYNFGLIGTRYMLECINIIYKKDLYNFNLTKDVYSVLSKKYNKPINTIKGDITQANINMCENCDKRVIMSYFGYFEDGYTPSPKEVMSTIFEKI